MRRSTRAAAKRAKQKIKAIQDYEDQDEPVLQLQLPQDKRKPVNRFKRQDPSLRLQLGLQKVKRTPLRRQIGSLQRHVLFLNIGDERILEAVQALLQNRKLPPWHDI